MISSGLLYVSRQVRAYFQANDVPATVAKVGRTYRTFELNQSAGGGSRVVFIPGTFSGEDEPKTVDFGELGGPSNHASVVNPRELWQWSKTFTMSIWGAPDITSPSDEELQYERTEDLFEWTMRALQNSVGGQADIERTPKVFIRGPPGESGFGVEFLVVATHDGPLFDVTMPLAFPGPGVNRGAVT
jgi:hypothetical protein